MEKWKKENKKSTSLYCVCGAMGADNIWGIWCKTG